MKLESQYSIVSDFLVENYPLCDLQVIEINFYKTSTSYDEASFIKKKTNGTETLEPSEKCP